MRKQPTSDKPIAGQEERFSFGYSPTEVDQDVNQSYVSNVYGAPSAFTPELVQKAAPWAAGIVVLMVLGWIAVNKKKKK